MQTNPKVTNIVLNGSAGAYITISTTIMASKVEIQEDPSLNNGVAQGLQGFYLDPNSNPANPSLDESAPGAQVWLANSAGQQGRAYQPILFGGADGRVHGGLGNYVGQAPLLKLRSNSATPTGILLVEWP